MISYEIYLINLDRSRDRLVRVDQDLRRLNIKYNRISAVDANSLPPSIYERVTAPNFEYPHTLKSGEIACFLSHRICWQKLVDSNKDWALILEDNCEFTSRAASYMNSTKWIPHECELIQLTFSKQPTFSNRQIILSDENLLLGLKYASPSGSSAYFISRNAALLALESSKQISCPLDNFLFGYSSCYTKKIQGWRLCNAVAKRAEISTTIHGRGSKNKNINIERLSPKRILKKIRIAVYRLFYLKKYKQIWNSN